jgi:phospholipid/cholesterol/gamma-HCH transport system ATP-binding protein
VDTLVFTDIFKAFTPAHPVLTGLTAEIPLKGLTFVVGKSGSGKSVLCRLAVGLLQPDAGKVELDGERIDTMPERRLQKVRARVPYLIQGPALLDWLTLEQNVALAARGAKDHGQVAAAIDRVGLGDFKSRFPPEVGPGIKKRTAIARALVLEPKYLLLDEPTTGLDREAAGQVNETLAVLKRQGLGAMVVSHDYKAVEQLADQVLVVSLGKAGFEARSAT